MSKNKSKGRGEAARVVGVEKVVDEVAIAGKMGQRHLESEV